MLYVLLSKNCVGIHTQLTSYAKSLACNTTNKFALTCTRRHSAANQTAVQRNCNNCV